MLTIYIAVNFIFAKKACFGSYGNSVNIPLAISLPAALPIPRSSMLPLFGAHTYFIYSTFPEE